MSWEIDLARDYARKGHSLSFTAQFIGVGPERLRRMLAEAGADIQFLKGRQSLAFREGQQRAAENRRGRPVRHPAILAALARGRQKMRERWLRWAFGVAGTLAELRQLRKCPLALSTLRWRIRHGMSTEDALQIPSRNPPPKGVMPPQFIEHVKKRRRHSALRMNDQVERLMTPTMLQYRSPRHTIVVTARQGACISVDVRDQTHTVLHQLHFIQSFESGVLFVFDPEVWGSMQRIAFEPDSPALARNR